MPKLVITHAVADVERWLKGKDERAAAIGAVGTNVTDHVAADGSNNVAITADVHDVAGAQAMLDSPSPETVALMESHGVLPPVTTYIEK
ncbi:MAG: hypothetical protein WCB51_05440 [Candidatus Dormiibacterota bacterium]